jgi:hypothetical protein
MNDELVRGYHRWRAVEEQGRDDDADAAFGTMFRDTVREQPVSLDFTARALEAVAAAAERDAQRVQRTRKVLVPVGFAAAAVLLYMSGGVLLSAMASSGVWLVGVLIGSVVEIATNAQAGIDLWSLARSLGRATAAFISSPTVTITIILVQGIAMAALIALQRLLGSDEGSYR